MQIRCWYWSTLRVPPATQASGRVITELSNHSLRTNTSKFRHCEGVLVLPEAISDCAEIASPPKGKGGGSQ